LLFVIREIVSKVRIEGIPSLGEMSFFSLQPVVTTFAKRSKNQERMGWCSSTCFASSFNEQHNFSMLYDLDSYLKGLCSILTVAL
jgi:hypothetical protein